MYQIQKELPHFLQNSLPKIIVTIGIMEIKKGSLWLPFLFQSYSGKYKRASDIALSAIARHKACAFTVLEAKAIQY